MSEAKGMGISMSNNKKIFDRESTNKHESQATKDNTSMDGEEFRPFNDATDHYHKIMGMPTKKADLKSMPLLVRWFAYFFYALIIVGIIAIVIGIIIQ